jgi:hypothetical protein
MQHSLDCCLFIADRRPCASQLAPLTFSGLCFEISFLVLTPLKGIARMKYSSNSLVCQCVLLILAAVLLPRNVYAQGNFVYTNDEGLFQNTVSGFSVGPDGSLTPVPGSPFATGGTSLGGGTGATNRIAVSTVGALPVRGKRTIG